ncbi:MAG: cytochrome b subunit of the bc complex [Nitrospirae bacterium]|nr:cytochrome b subunit of the bc complex [Nitrospirota bacterium]
MAKKKKEKYEKGAVPFIPVHILKEAAAAYIFLGILIPLAILYPFEAMEPANPFVTPEHIKPEWYFLAAYQILRLVPSKALGLTVQAIAILAIILLPFWDTGAERNFRKRPLFAIIAAISVLAYMALTIWGMYS